MVRGPRKTLYVRTFPATTNCDTKLEITLFSFISCTYCSKLLERFDIWAIGFGKDIIRGLKHIVRIIFENSLNTFQNK